MTCIVLAWLYFMKKRMLLYLTSMADLKLEVEVFSVFLTNPTKIGSSMTDGLAIVLSIGWIGSGYRMAPSSLSLLFPLITVYEVLSKI